jgi:hypothetical protein
MHLAEDFAIELAESSTTATMPLHFAEMASAVSVEIETRTAARSTAAATAA